jgi:murein L,D-transpeptidase YcbB/YkuD
MSALVPGKNNPFVNVLLLVLLVQWMGLSPVWAQQGAQGSQSTVSTSKPKEESAAVLRIKELMNYYDELASEQCWSFFPTDTVLRKGDQSDLVFGLRSNLVLTEDLSSANDSLYNTFDAALEIALKRFQTRHGLAADGIFRKSTIDAMNISLCRRVEQLEMNLERWRQLEASASHPFLLVNIADYSLTALNDNGNVLKMNVVVGKPTTKTTQLQSEIKSVVLNPSWDVPQSIAVNEILPALQKDAQYLATHHMKLYKRNGAEKTEVDPATINWQQITGTSFIWAIEQMPGSWNALGKVKVLFPNPYNIYLHDTPQKQYFSKARRSYSHGCIRVENPVELASYLLGDQSGWSKEKIQQYLDTNPATQTIPLKQPIPIIVEYFTAWIDANGQPQFREDVYQYDQKLRELHFSL